MQYSQYSSSKPWAIFGLLLSVLSLAAALFFQIYNDWFPCPLCILQRYAYLLTACGFVGLIFTRCNPPMSRVFALLTLVAFCLGAGLAFYQVWVLANPAQSCGVDPLQNTLNALPWVQYWPAMFTADGLCTQEYPPLLGLSLPMWSGLCFLVQGLVLLIALRTRRHIRGSW